MSHSLLNLLHSLPGLIEQGGYWLISIIVILEGVPLLGSLVPGHVVIIAAGFLAKVGILTLPMVLIVTIISALIGDLIGFYIGRRYGYSFIGRVGKYLFIRDEHIEKAKKLIDGHTGKSLIIGKFSPFTRPFAPFLVGASGVKPQTFYFFNLIGTFLWVGISVMLGYFFGAGYGAVSGILGKSVLIALILTILILWGYRFVNERFHIFRKYELFVLILNLLSLWGLAKTIQDALSLEPFLINFDEWVNWFVAAYSTNFLISCAHFVSNVGSAGVTTALGIIVGGAFLIKKKWRRGMIMLLSVCSSIFVVTVLKDLFGRVRPHNALQILSDASFPSSHATLAAAFFVALAYVLLPRIHSWVKREVLIVIFVFAIIAIGLSRLVLSVHWASDVIAGWCLGVFIATGTILFVRYVGGLLMKRDVKTKQDFSQS